MRAAEQSNLPKAEEFDSVTGMGVRAQIEGKKILMGNRSMMRQNHISIDKAEKDMQTLERQGKTVMLMALDGEIKAIFAVADAIKPESPQAVRMLSQMKLKSILLTGDNQQTAQAIAKQAGIEQVFAEVSPADKAEKVKSLQKEGVVAMVGDGINDAPALAAADVGIAIGTGTDIAMEASDVTLMRGDLREIPAAIRLSRATMRKIKQNLFWAFIYNSIGIPFAALGLLSPIIAGAAMAFSSVSVVANSLTLKFWRA